MKCKDFQNKIIFFIDGELDKESSIKFESHIKSCNECRQLFEKVNSSYSHINEDRIAEINPFFYSRIAAAIESEKQNTVNSKLLKNKKFAWQIASYLIIGIFAIVTGYFIANDKNYVEQDQYEVTDEELFADSHHLTLSTDDLYVVSSQEIEE